MSAHFRVARATVLTCTVAFILAGCSDATLPTDVDVGDALEAKGGVPGKPDKGNDGGGGNPDEGGGEEPEGHAEEFEAWDASRWVASDKWLHQTLFSPDHVTVSDGILSLTAPAGTFEGGEIKSVDKFRFGAYEARIRASTEPGSLTAFFLYEFSDKNIDEIDIEIVPDWKGRGPHLLFNTYLRSRHTNASAVRAADIAEGFDIGEFHDYRIESSRKSVRFYVDGLLVEEFTDGVPTARMYLMASLWWPTWLDGGPPETATVSQIDWIDF